MRRYPDWPTRLWRAIDERKLLPHAWGANDCAIYVADLIEAMTGEDMARLFRGSYSDEAGANSILAAHGWENLEDLASASLPRREAPRRGDVVLLPGELGPYLALSMGAQAIAADVRRPRLRAMTGILGCWGVG